jgi:hypothetical protein
VTSLRDFERFLVSQMRGHVAVAASRSPLAADTDEKRAALREVERTASFLDLVARELDAYTCFLGPPLATTSEPGIAPNSAFGGSRRHRFHLPSWPEFDFVLRTHPGGWVWGPEFVRRPGVEAPPVARLADLRPWAMVESEVAAHFGLPADEAAWNLGKDATYRTEDRSAGATKVVLAFDFALLQSVVSSA